MRYGIFSDIHGNLEALQAVLTKLQEERVDKYICAGDIVGYGGNPRECLQLVLDMHSLIVAGNYEYALAGRINVDFFCAYTRESLLWTRTQLSGQQIEFLGHLDLLLQVDELFTVAHGTFDVPRDFDYIQHMQDAEKNFAALKTPIGFFGHSHVPVIFLPGPPVAFTMQQEIAVTQGSRLLVNAGSVGQPRDEDPRACCVVYDDKAGKIWTHRVAYDIDTACKKIIQAGLPEILGERLKMGR